MAKSLINGAQFKFVVLNSSKSSSEFNAGKVYLKIENTAASSIFFKGQFYHNHQLSHQKGKMEFEIPAGSSKLVEIEIASIKASIDTTRLDPLELDWTISYPTVKLKTPFELNGTTPIPVNFSPQGLEFTEMDVFFNEHSIDISHPFENLLVKYTLDGSEPTFQSKTYENPILINQTSTLKAR